MSPMTSFSKSWLLAVGLGIGLIGSGCTIEWGSSAKKAEPEATPAAPKVRKLYAPGAEPDPSPTEAPEASGDEGAETAEAPSAESAALAAALLGTNRKAPEPDPAPTPKVRRRRRARAAAQAETEEVLDEPAEPGSLSDGAFQSAITDWSGMKRCLAGSARLGPATGALQVRFTIRGDGQVVKSAVVDASNDTARAIAPCVVRRARRIRFPAFAAASDEVEKTAKFVF